MYVFTLTYTQIHSYTLITFTYSVCFWGYVSVCECKCMYVHMYTPNNTQLPSNTIKNTQIHSKHSYKVYFSVCECYECIWVYLSNLSVLSVCEFYECIWVYLRVFESFWVFKSVFECIWVYLSVFECMWVYVSVCECYECIRVY